ncbi:MAG: hypothetical protein NC253_11360 [Ruminococcus sp.]|nr:hypothetical protein [Ruminococcus sp.]
MIVVVIILAIIAIFALFKWFNYYLSTAGLLYYLLNKYDDEVTVEQMRDIAIKAFEKNHNLK